MSSKRYIPLLITIALLALIGLQGLWLFMVYKHKAQELKDKTREAALETTKRLQQEEDSKLIINNMDSLLLTEDIIGSDTASPMRVIVSNIRNKIKFDTIRGETFIEHKIEVNNDSSKTTTILKVGNNTTKKVIVSSGSSDNIQAHNGNMESYSYVISDRTELRKEKVELEKLAEQLSKKAEQAAVAAKSAETKAKRLEKKAGELQTLFLKMAVESSNNHLNSLSQIDFGHVKELMADQLKRQGIDIEPEVVISSLLKGTDNVKEFFPGMATTGVHPDSTKYLFNQSFVSTPLFPNNLINKKLFLEVGFMSTANYILKSMSILIILSLVITLSIGFVMVYLFRRMLSQEKLHHMKNDFINNMTHELKTPIATISLAVDAINNPSVKNDEERFRNYTGILKEENKKLNSHVERVLQMAMLDKGEMVLDKKALNIKNILENCINAYQLQIQNRNGKVNLNVNDNIFVSGDEFHLTNAFTNLLDNALKYSGTDPVINILAQKDGNEIEIRFSDNGIGIDKTEQEKIFDKFYRVQGGNLHDVKGFGLGLSYVRSIIEAHTGTIELISEKNKGSEFIIKLRSHEA